MLLQNITDDKQVPIKLRGFQGKLGFTLFHRKIATHKGLKIAASITDSAMKATEVMSCNFPVSILVLLPDFMLCYRRQPEHIFACFVPTILSIR